MAAILVGSRDHRTQFWKGAIQGPFHQSLVAIGPVVSEKIKMWNIDGGTTDEKWWHKNIQGLWFNNGKNSVIPKILESRRWTCTLQDFLFQHARNPRRFTNLIHWNVSKLPPVSILVMANVDIHGIVSTIQNYENRTVTAIFRQ